MLIKNNKNAENKTNQNETWKFLCLLSTGVIVVLGGSFHFGYQISLINPLADVLQNFLERGLKEYFF